MCNTSGNCPRIKLRPKGQSSGVGPDSGMAPNAGNSVWGKPIRRAMPVQCEADCGEVRMVGAKWWSAGRLPATIKTEVDQSDKFLTRK